MDLRRAFDVFDDFCICLEYIYISNVQAYIDMN